MCTDLSVCVRSFVCVCVCVCVCVSVCAHAHACVHVCASVHTCELVCVCVCLCVSISVCMHAHTCAHILLLLSICPLHMYMFSCVHPCALSETAQNYLQKSELSHMQLATCLKRTQTQHHNAPQGQDGASYQVLSVQESRWGGGTKQLVQVWRPMLSVHTQQVGRY